MTHGATWIVAVGERDGHLSERARAADRLFREAGAESRVSPNIETDLWRKFLFLASLAAACGLARAPVGIVLAAPLGAELVGRAVGEIAAVGRARGVTFGPDEEAQALARIRGLAPELKPSFLVDLEHGGPTELDILSAAVSRSGASLGIRTPVRAPSSPAVTASLAARQSRPSAEASRRRVGRRSRPSDGSARSRCGDRPATWRASRPTPWIIVEDIAYRKCSPTK